MPTSNETWGPKDDKRNDDDRRHNTDRREDQLGPAMEERRTAESRRLVTRRLEAAP